MKKLLNHQDTDYPERLKLFKEEEKDQDHYFTIVDEDGNPVSSVEKKWYPIKDGYLSISFSSLTYMNSFSQGGRNFKHNKDEEIERDLDERLEGEGKLQSGTSNTGGLTNISHFGNSNKYDEIGLIIRGGEVEQEYFSLFGIKSFVDDELSQEELFTLDIVLNTERFNDLKKIVKEGSVEKIYISIWLGNVPGLYSSWWRYGGSTFGNIKYFDYENPDHILNKEEFEEKYINSLVNRIESDLGSGVDFTITTREKVGGFSVPKTPLEKRLSEDKKNDEYDDFLEDKPLSKEEKEDIRRNQEINIEKQKLSTQISIFWGIVVIGILLLLTLWFQ